jgi:hypothetical protein
MSKRKCKAVLPDTEVVWFQGVRYGRRPGEDYFWGSVQGKQKSLHRAVWEHCHGEIPLGCDIHHKDENPSNNDISNLECLTKKQHRQLHKDAHKTPSQLKLLDRIRPLAAEWHGTREGLEWHKKHGKKTWEGKPYRKCKCINCRKVFKTRCQIDPKYCSASCLEKHHRTMGKYSRLIKCPVCKEAKLVDKRSTCCSKKCAWVLRRGER